MTKKKVFDAWKKSYLGVFLALAILAMAACFSPAMLKLVDLIEQHGVEKGVHQANHLPSMQSDSIKMWVEEFGKGHAWGSGYSAYGYETQFGWPAAHDIRDFLVAE